MGTSKNTLNVMLNLFQHLTTCSDLTEKRSSTFNMRWRVKPAMTQFIIFRTLFMRLTQKLKTGLIISNNLDYLNNDRFENLISKVSEIQKMLRGLQKSNNS
jgi:hypothetical protein